MAITFLKAGRGRGARDFSVSQKEEEEQDMGIGLRGRSTAGGRTIYQKLTTFRQKLGQG